MRREGGGGVSDLPFYFSHSFSDPLVPFCPLLARLPLFLNSSHPAKSSTEHAARRGSGGSGRHGSAPPVRSSAGQ